MNEMQYFYGKTSEKRRNKMNKRKRFALCCSNSVTRENTIATLLPDNSRKENEYARNSQDHMRRVCILLIQSCRVDYRQRTNCAVASVNGGI